MIADEPEKYLLGKGENKLHCIHELDVSATLSEIGENVLSSGIVSA